MDVFAALRKTAEKKGLADYVRNVIQGLINGEMALENFVKFLRISVSRRQELNTFLSHHLPYLRNFLISGEITIDGILPPQPQVVNQSKFMIQGVS